MTPLDKKSDMEVLKELYRAIFENSGTGMALIRKDDTIALINREFEKMSGYTKAMVENSTRWTDYIPEQEEIKNLRRYYKQVQTNPDTASESFDTRIKISNGNVIHVLLRLTVIPETAYSLASLLDITEKKIAEEKLRFSEEKYRSLINNMQDCLYQCNINGDLSFVAPSGARLLGHDSPDELIGKNIANDYYADPGARGPLLEKLKKDGRIMNYEVTLKRKDGTLVIVQTNSYLSYDESGNILGVEGIFSDITFRKQAEEKIYRNELRFKNITTNLPGVVYQIFANYQGEYKVTYVSENISEIFGIPADCETFVDELVKNVHEDDKKNIALSIVKAVYGKTQWDFEGRYIKPTGEMIWFHGMSTVSNYEEGMLFDGIVLDITQRKTAEEMLTVSEDKFMKIFMTVPFCIAITRLKDGTLIDANKGYEDILGWKREDVIGKTWADPRFNCWVNPSDHDYMISELSQGRGIINREFQFKTADHTPHTGIYSARTITVTGDSCILFILQDITDFKKLQEERRKLEKQLFQTQKMDAIGKLAGGIAHDFNNILTVIQANTSLMLLKSKTGDGFFRRLHHINEQVTRGADLTQQLLGFARGGKYEVKSIRINHLIRKSVQFFVETKKEIKTHVELGENINPVEADAGQIEQVLLNIFINAAHAMPNGGYLHIKTENLTIEERESKIFEIAPGNFVKISISDTGTGMNKKTLSRIFEPFFTTKSETGGTGLGLASAYGIIRNHGGSIRAYSEPGKGTTFTILLPSSHESRMSGNHEHQKNNGLLTGEGGILIVEDEVMILEASSNLLEMIGYTVYQATTGKEAISAYFDNKKEIRLVILDMIMPGMNGSEVFKAIKKDNADIKFILTSGYSMQGEVQKVMDMGCDAFIQKPYNFIELSNLVHSTLYPPESSEN